MGLEPGQAESQDFPQAPSARSHAQASFIQRVVGLLAGSPGDASSISFRRQTSRSIVSEAEHVGEQIEGVGGWRASGGKTGIPSGTMAGGDEGGNLLAQACSSAASITGSSVGHCGLFLGMADDLQLLCLSTGFLCTRGLLRCRGGAGIGSAVAGERGARGGCIGLSATYAHLL